MKTKILMLVMVLAWALCGTGDVYAEGFEGLSDIPSTGEMVMIGVGVVFVITFIIVAALNLADDGEAKGAEEAEEEIDISRIEPAAEVKLRIDPVLTLQKNAVGAGLSLSF